MAINYFNFHTVMGLNFTFLKFLEHSVRRSLKNTKLHLSLVIDFEGAETDSLLHQNTTTQNLEAYQTEKTHYVKDSRASQSGKGAKNGNFGKF